MELYCSRSGRLWIANLSKGATRDVAAEAWKRITKQQRQQRHYSVLVFEPDDANLHAHIIFLGNAEIAARLRKSRVFGDVFNDPNAIKPIYDSQGLTKGYLAKTRTPQAGYCRYDLGGRLPGSHKLPGGGDRVRLSHDLERDAIEADYVKSWQHTYARRSPGRKSYRPRPLTRRAPREAGQIPLLPELKPVARLRDFGGGLMPPTVAWEIEHRRRRLDLSQQQLAAIIGRSQSQYANAIRGHDPISGTATNRLRELLLPAAKPHQHDMLGAPVIDLDEPA
jgi:hypothetical protein